MRGNRLLHLVASVILITALTNGGVHAQWFDPITEQVSGGTLGTQSLVLDDLGVLHLVYLLNGVQYKSKPSQGQWSAPSEISSTGTNASICVNKIIGVPYVVFIEDSVRLKLGRWAGGRWELTTLATPGFTYPNYPAAVVDLLGNVHIVLTGNHQGNIYQIGYGYWDGVSFHFQNTGFSSLASSLWPVPSIATFPGGEVALAFPLNGSIDVVENSALGGSSWTTQFLTSPPYAMIFSDLQTSVDGGLHIATGGTSGMGEMHNVYYSRQAPGSQFFDPLQLVTSPTAYPGNYPRLVIENNTIAHIAYQIMSGIVSLYMGYATNKSGPWTCQIINTQLSIPGTEALSSFVMDPTGNGSITFTKNGGLYYYGQVELGQHPPYVGVTVLSVGGIAVPSGGGSLNFNIRIRNNESMARTFDVWNMIKLPLGTWYGPVLGPVRITLPSSVNILRARSQTVPGSAPAGNYIYQGRVGVYPDSVWNSGEFGFYKTGHASGVISDWSNTGDPFPGLAQTLDHYPVTCNLSDASPNPFNPITVLSFELRVPSLVRLTVWDTAGRLVTTLVDGWRGEGTYKATFDGSKLSSGIYFVKMQTGDVSQVRKMMLIR